MIWSYNFYLLFAIIAFSYGMCSLIKTCMLHNRREAENGDGDGNSDNNNNNSNNNEGDSDNNNNNNDEAGKRLELIRGRLDFRKIVPPSELPDLERGEERRYDSYVSNSNNNDNNNDRNSNSNVSRASLGQLVEMGFGVHASTKALNAVGGSDTESAMNWIFEHSTDPNLNDDPSSNSKTTVTMLNLDAGDDDDVPITPADSNNNNNNSTVRSLFSAPFSFFNRVGGSAGGGSVSGTAARNEECCSICLEPFSVGDTVARLKKDAIAVTTNTDQVACNHCFHEDCILEWLQNHDDCPLCRGNMIST